MSVPDGLLRLLNKAFEVVDDDGVAHELCEFGTRVYELAYHERLKERTPEDNRPEHELVVLRNTMRICWRSGRERDSGHPFNRQELRVAVATSLLHDLRFIPRITEEMIKIAEQQGRHEEAADLRRRKASQRVDHMRGSAEDAIRIVRSHSTLMTEAESRQCIGYIALHDIWKLGWPYPVSSDWLAVCCLEGDALWPLDPDFGCLADLERKNTSCPSLEQLRQQAELNLETQLRTYRANFAVTAEQFRDGETIIRTSEGARILSEVREYWRI
jgi:hypothetical protein